jgi:ABC-type branched-subunit amino acid transport system ATPase component
VTALSDGPLVDVQDLTKHYGPLTALSRASFSVRRGEILGLIGPNGSGKTSLFECVAGVLPADGGTVRVVGRSLEPRARARISSIFPTRLRRGLCRLLAGRSILRSAISADLSGGEET